MKYTRDEAKQIALAIYRKEDQAQIVGYTSGELLDGKIGTINITIADIVKDIENDTEEGIGIIDSWHSLLNKQGRFEEMMLEKYRELYT